MSIDDPWAPERDPRLDERWQNIIRPTQKPSDANAETMGNFLRPQRLTPPAPREKPQSALPYTLTPHEGDDPFTARAEAGPEDQPEHQPEHPLVGLGRRFGEELQDPRARERLIRLMKTEISDQGPRAAQAFAETVRNRRYSPSRKHRHVWDTMNDAGYYPRVSLIGGAPSDEQRAVYDRAIDAAIGGSNISGGATGNASGSVGFAGGPQTYNPGTGERFGIEGPDHAWMTALLQGKTMPAGPDMTEDYQSGDKTVQLRALKQIGMLPKGIPADWTQPIGIEDALKLAQQNKQPAPQLPDIPPIQTKLGQINPYVPLPTSQLAPPAKGIVM